MTAIRAVRNEGNFLDVFSREARVDADWQPQPVPEGLLREVSRVSPARKDGHP